MKKPTKPELSDWIPRRQAAQILGVDERTVNRYVAAKRIERRYVRVPGRVDLPVLNPRDVERIRQETLEPRPFVEGKALAVRPPAPVDFPKVGIDLAAFAELRAVEVSQKKLFLTLDEASRYAGLPRPLIARLARSGQLPAVKLRGRGGGWRVHREGLEEQLVALLLLPKDVASLV